MNMNHRPLIAALLLSAGLGGCASTSDLEALRAELDTVRSSAQSANTSADQAAQAAAAAQTSAERAQEMASEANATAQRAASQASEALSRTAETETKIDRMFKKAMYK